uniref:Uncharacterized protein n=1 Tax=Ciona savignyi TaxID=51511 RepID=H2ZLX5_CIOSA
MGKMEDLLVKLQDYEQHLQDLKAQESYLAEKYRSILKPWPIKCEAEPPPKNEEEEAATTSSNGLKEVEKMLEKARVVRSKHSAPRTKSAPKCKDCVKGNCSKHKSLKTIKSKSTSTSTSAKTEVGSKPNIKTEAKPTKSETFLPKRQQNYKYVNFEEVLQENPIPQKILKLRAMHEKLKANEVFDSMFMELPCEAEKRFISKLRGCGGSTDNDILTSVAVNNKIEECVAVAERLIEALSAFKEPEFGVDLKFMYHRKSLLAHAQALVEDLDKMFSYIHKVEVIDFGESENIPQMELDEISSFHQYFV